MDAVSSALGTPFLQKTGPFRCGVTDYVHHLRRH
jgi:hypothetical protein